MSNWAVVAAKVPAAAHPRLQRLVGAYSGRIRLAAPRKSKWGDFRWQAGQPSQISINRDLSPEAFLITLLHEFAHAQVHAWDPHYSSPHGPEWQSRYRQLVLPFLTPDIFPPALLTALQRSLYKPKASCGADVALLKALQADLPKRGQTVESLPPGSLFKAPSGRIFTKGPKRRTRFSCVELKTGRTFAVHPLTDVELVNPPAHGR